MHAFSSATVNVVGINQSIIRVLGCFIFFFASSFVAGSMRCRNSTRPKEAAGDGLLVITRGERSPARLS